MITSYSGFGSGSRQCAPQPLLPLIPSRKTRQPENRIAFRPLPAQYHTTLDTSLARRKTIDDIPSRFSANAAQKTDTPASKTWAACVVALNCPPYRVCLDTAQFSPCFNQRQNFHHRHTAPSTSLKSFLYFRISSPHLQAVHRQSTPQLLANAPPRKFKLSQCAPRNAAFGS